jgi:putative flippase GtrA
VETTILKGVLSQFIRFGAVGVVGTIAHYLILICLVQILGIDAIMASIAGFTTGAIVNYFLNYHFTFHSNKRHKETLTKCFSIALLGLLLNSSIMTAAIRCYRINYILAQMIATGIVLICTFTGNRLWTFHEKRKVEME